MWKVFFLFILILFSINIFAQFNEAVKINDDLPINFAGQAGYKAIDNEVFIVYTEEEESDIAFDITRLILKHSTDFGLNYTRLVIDSLYVSFHFAPQIEILDDGTILILYISSYQATIAVSNDNGLTFSYNETDILNYSILSLNKTNNNIYLTNSYNNFRENINPIQKYNSLDIILEESVRGATIEENGIRPFPSEADIVYVKLNGTSYTSFLGYNEHVGDSSFVVYNSYPDTAHPFTPIGDSIWVNQVPIYEINWVEGPSGNVENQSVWVEAELWIEGNTENLQSWGTAEKIYITNDLTYSNTDIGSSPFTPLNFNATDFLCLYSEQSIFVKYKHYDPFVGEIVSPNCDGQVNVYAYTVSLPPDSGNIFDEDWGVFSCEYKHPHGSTPDFLWINPETNEQKLLTYIDLHKYIYPDNPLIPESLRDFVIHGGTPPENYPACGYPYERTDYNNPEVPPYGTDYPWYNPVWPESSEDIVFDRGELYHFGASAQRRRGRFTCGGGISPQHTNSGLWDIDNFIFDGSHTPCGYNRNFEYDVRLFNQEMIDWYWYNPSFDSYSVYQFSYNDFSLSLIDQYNSDSSYNNILTCSNDSLLIIGRHTQESNTIDFKSYDSNANINEFFVDLSLIPGITNPKLQTLKLTDKLYIHVMNTDLFFYNDEYEYLITYDIENHEIDNLKIFDPEFTRHNFNISSNDMKVFTTCNMTNNQTQFSLDFNFSYSENWENNHLLETDFSSFTPQHCEYFVNFNENDSVFVVINIPDSSNYYYDTYLLSGSFNNSSNTSDTYSKKNHYSLSAYPNPFNPTTTISFSIPDKSLVTLSVYNIKGQKVKTITNQEYDKGNHSIIWNGDNDKNKEVSSGVYFYKMDVDNKTKSVRKCLLVK